MQRQAGFTLLEILLVVVLMSLGALAVVQTLPQSQNDQAKEQASRFFQRLQLLSDDAILNGQDYGVRLDEKKSTYHYMQLKQEGWQPVKESKYFTETSMGDDVTLSFELGGDAWSDSDRLFKQEDFYEDRFEDEEKKPKPPQVYVLSSGEVTPFEVSFLSDNQQSLENRWRVNVTEAGIIQLLAPGEENE
ncbi:MULTISPECIES: type II secretion system minor pseudopilin GspH [Vibrio]|uniref:Type II secretion system protein H n=1 Tax=Vibrio casei TaxID=673372 RepID=A0A368LGP3_9VIBR|nr:MULTISPECIES: type II secretion system minor pseudopilin GspH [Vibrio]RCS69202.1 type II secretion system protein GspH [Vibrio casei]SJN37787.1 General secretion pathway protein H [Vibrio casei]HBV76275.1 type II secretion system protein GspH [Vibrio sp.]